MASFEPLDAARRKRFGAPIGRGPRDTVWQTAFNGGSLVQED